MDAIKFIEEKERMCRTCRSCILCPAWLDDGCVVSVRSGFTPEQQINTVKAWSEQHPRKTRQSVFLEQYPNARIDSQAVIYVCPADAYGDKVCPKNEENVRMPCRDCRRNFWLQEVE